mgnify:CR=1 FL=1
MKEPSKSDWAALYQAAIAFQHASPWEWMDNEDLFAVENPYDGEMGYCSILGSGQEEFGLGIFLGDKGFVGYLELISSEVEPEDIDESIMLPLLSMLFVDRGTLQKKDLDVIRSLGLRFRGRNAWPLFRSQRPGYAPWFLEKEEVLFLSIAIHQALVVATKVRNNELDLWGKESEDLILTRYCRDNDWLEEWREPKIPDSSSQTHTEAVGAVNEARLHLLRTRAGRLSGAWELDIFVLPMPIGPASSRPYFPSCFLTVERKLGLIIDSKLTKPWLTLSEKQDELIQILEKAEQLPRHIWVRSDKIRLIVEPITRSLGINLRVGRLSMLEEAKASLHNYLSGHDA